MAYVPLEVALISAKDLANVNVFSKMEVYAVATISSDAIFRKKTPVDREGSKNPTWNSELKLNVMEYDIDRAVLHVVLKSERALGDREIGEVHVPVSELLDGWNRAVAAVAGGGGCGGGASSGCSGDFDKKVPAAQFVSYQVRKNAGKAKGVLNISYKFGEFSCHTPTHVSGDLSAATYTGGSPPPAYPPHAGPTYPQPAGSTYPHAAQPGYGYAPPPGYPPQHGYRYPPQQQGGYGYPQQQHGYGYGYGGPPAQPPEHGSSALGGAAAGLGLGLLSGAIGGILGAVVADAME